VPAFALFISNCKGILDGGEFTNKVFLACHGAIPKTLPVKTRRRVVSSVDFR
jgi:hypothetical protein